MTQLLGLCLVFEAKHQGPQLYAGKRAVTTLTAAGSNNYLGTHYSIGHTLLDGYDAVHGRVISRHSDPGIEFPDLLRNVISSRSWPQVTLLSVSEDST